MKIDENKYNSDINKYWGDLWKDSERGLDITDTVTPFKFKYFLKLFIDKLPKQASVCEIGSGNCQWLLLIRAYRPDLKLYGIDLSDEAIKIGKACNVEMLQADTRNIPIEDSRFDFVYSWGVIEHMPEYKKAFQEHYRIAKYFISLDVPCLQSYPGWRQMKKMIADGMTKYEMMIESGRFFKKKEFSNLVKEITSPDDNYTIINNYVALPCKLKFLEPYLPDYLRKRIGHNIGVTIQKNY